MLPITRGPIPNVRTVPKLVARIALRLPKISPPAAPASRPKSATSPRMKNEIRGRAVHLSFCLKLSVFDGFATLGRF